MSRRPKTPAVNQLSKRSITMNRFGFAAVVASGFIAAILGLAAPAQATTGPNAPTLGASAINIPADVGHHAWVIDIQPHVDVPHR
jgi:hypothetical protein